MKTFYIDNIRKYLMEQRLDAQNVSVHERSMRRFDTATLIEYERELLRKLINFMDKERKEIDEYIEHQKDSETA
jgi:hypothetical protein